MHIRKFNESKKDVTVIKLFGDGYSNIEMMPRFYKLRDSEVQIHLTKEEIDRVNKLLYPLFMPTIDKKFSKNTFGNWLVNFKPEVRISNISIQKFEDDWYIVHVSFFGKSNSDSYLCDEFKSIELVTKILSGEVPSEEGQTEW